MTQYESGLYFWTRIPQLYSSFQSVLGGRRARESLVRDYVRPSAGERVLDFGCGPGTMLPFLGEVEYVGVDSNEHHIARAKRRFGIKGRFFAGRADSAENVANGRYDLIICIGLWHHLEDAEVQTLVQFARAHLASNGRMVAVDPAFTPDQHPFARLMAKADAGRRVRTPEAYYQLASFAFDHVEVFVRHDLLRVPYTHCVTCAH